MDEKKQRQRILVGTALAFLLFIDLLPYLWLLISSFRAIRPYFIALIIQKIDVIYLCRIIGRNLFSNPVFFSYFCVVYANDVCLSGT